MIKESDNPFSSSKRTNQWNNDFTNEQTISDLLCSASYDAPALTARHSFFTDFANRLKSTPGVTKLRSVEKARAPVIKVGGFN